MPAKPKLTDADLKKIRRRLRAGARRGEVAAAYGVNRKTIQRRLKALELAEAEPGPTSELDDKPAASEQAGTSAAAGRSSSPEASDRARGPASAGRYSRRARISRFREGTYEHWLDERDARLPARPDPRVLLVAESGRTVGRTSASNAERMVAAFAGRFGPLRVVPA